MLLNNIMKTIINKLLLIVVIFLFSCDKTLNNSEAKETLIPFKQSQKILADKIISCFENDSPIIQYGYIENLNDGRGYTAGKAGFTTATADLLAVVQKYTELQPINSLSQFIPLLQLLADSASSNISGLENLPTAWTNSVADSKFIDAQDFISDLYYYNPAVQYCKELGIKLPVSLLCIYDCCIQHGDGDDPDGLSAMINQTNNHFVGSPFTGVDEITWILKFNEIRTSTLLNPNNTSTQQEWSESVGRVVSLNKLLQIYMNLKLTQSPIQINPYGTNHIINL
jgi:chitosanase